MQQSIYQHIVDNHNAGHKSIAMLIDPDKYSPVVISNLVSANALPDYFFVGGSLLHSDFERVVSHLKNLVPSVPIIIFPGDSAQVSPNADAILVLSLISGRNPEYLIGQHVRAAHAIVSSHIEPIPVGYMLIDGGQVSAVQYVSNTLPLPAHKPDLAVATALAGQLLGLKMLYLEAGSGAVHPVPTDTIRSVRHAVSMPLIVGGGLRTPSDIESAFNSGADIVVVGTAIEQSPDIALNIMRTHRQ